MRRIMKARLSIGALMMLAGFTVYQLGLYVAFHQAGPLEQLARQLLPPINGSTEMSNFLLQLAGGLVAIFGFVLFTTGFIRPPPVATAGRQKSIEQPVPEPKTVVIKACRFCGAKMPEPETFCPACKKAQG